MTQVKHSIRTPQETAATNLRSFRTFLLMAQFEAREIGARIAQARKERGLTQEQLAEMAPFSKRSLQDYENGTTIPYRHLRDLGRLLQRPEEWFLYGDSQEETGAAIKQAVRDAVREILVQEQFPRLEELAAALDRLEAAVTRLEEERAAPGARPARGSSE